SSVTRPSESLPAICTRGMACATSGRSRDFSPRWWRGCTDVLSVRMKILALTAGAANMYCGSCLRDNTLAAELLAQGHDVILAPLYTPTLTDETNVSYGKVFFGGISVYLQQSSALFRKTPWVLDQLWDSLFALKLASRSQIPTNPKL